MALKVFLLLVLVNCVSTAIFSVPIDRKAHRSRLRSAYNTYEAVESAYDYEYTVGTLASGSIGQAFNYSAEYFNHCGFFMYIDTQEYDTSATAILYEDLSASAPVSNFNPATVELADGGDAYYFFPISDSFNLTSVEDRNTDVQSVMLTPGEYYYIEVTATNSTTGAILSTNSTAEPDIYPEFAKGYINRVASAPFILELLETCVQFPYATILPQGNQDFIYQVSSREYELQLFLETQQDLHLNNPAEFSVEILTDNPTLFEEQPSVNLSAIDNFHATVPLKFEIAEEGTANVSIVAMTRFDSSLVEFTLNLQLFVDLAPEISALGDESVAVNSELELKFEVSDQDHPDENITVVVHSENEEVLPDSALTLSNCDEDKSECILLIKTGSITGSTTITITATDPDASGEETFVVTVAESSSACHSQRMWF
eukprot:TRINITY_DN732_c0_g1_i1.p1 TRINITY_DN732_c0_g1~~TRINITY_DN732_c0_g1_i1.p1  ORF type:complete len:429 (+),score=59.78 TRINITY_DN732_c0_g1_i1:57-1343(+)